MCLAAVLLSLPAAHAADLAIRVVVVNSLRSSVQTPHRIAFEATRGADKVDVALVRDDTGARLVFTP